jgi:hypothetical protein
MRGCDARLLLVGLSIVLAGCYGAYQTSRTSRRACRG